MSGFLPQSLYFTLMLGTLRRSGDAGWCMNEVTIQPSSATSHVTPSDAGISLGLGLTNECNLSCAFCYRDPTRADRLSLDQVKAVMERSEEHTSELQSQSNLVCRLLLEKKK